MSELDKSVERKDICVLCGCSVYSPPFEFFFGSMFKPLPYCDACKTKEEFRLSHCVARPYRQPITRPTK